MRDPGRLLGLGGLALACVSVAAVVAGYWTAPSTGNKGAVAPTIVNVIAGKPTEFAFKLSKSSALPWNAAAGSQKVTFKVRNGGSLAHAFKVCTIPLEGALTNSCVGKGTKTLKPAQSATLAVTFKARGTYEYLSSVPGQAARGMKGVIGVGVALPKKATTTPGKTTPSKPSTPSTPSTPSSPATPSTPSAPSTPSVPDSGAGGNVAAGAAVWASAGCGSCHSFGSVKGNTGPDLNLIHPGPFDNGPLTAAQIRDLIAFLSSQ
jgi:uncharacterized cupredoxin-like copper-binding protein